MNEVRQINKYLYLSIDQEAARLPTKFRPKCPDCGSTLKKGKKSGYYCPNSECRVIDVYFDRYFRVEKTVREGPQAFALAVMKKRD